MGGDLLLAGLIVLLVAGSVAVGSLVTLWYVGRGLFR